MFLDNKYSKLYFSIVEKARSENRVKGLDRYYEMHHIVPRSMGGDNSISNLILLTAREHFLCHLLLVKFVASSEDRMKMACAFNRFKTKTINSRLFNQYKNTFSDMMKGKNNPSYGKVWCHNPSTSEIAYIKKTDLTSKPDFVLGLPIQKGGHRNTIWINDGTNECLIPKQSELPNGWVHGRLTLTSNAQLRAMSKARHTAEKDDEHKISMIGRRRMINHKTGESKSIKSSEIQKYQDQGFVFNDNVVTTLSKRCSIDGILFDSLASAAKYHNVAVGVVAYRLKSNNEKWKTWVIK